MLLKKSENNETSEFSFLEKEGDNYEFGFWSENLEIEIDENITLVNGASFLSEKEFKIHKLRQKVKLVESVNGAVDEEGRIVDTRDFPNRPKIN